MRKVSEKTVLAMIRGEKCKSGNTRAENHTLFLHDNAIAIYCPRTDTVACTMAGWGTVTTRERLNAVLTMLHKPYGFYQKEHEQVLLNKMTGDLQSINEHEIVVL